MRMLFYSQCKGQCVGRILHALSVYGICEPFHSQLVIKINESEPHEVTIYNKVFATFYWENDIPIFCFSHDKTFHQNTLMLKYKQKLLQHHLDNLYVIFQAESFIQELQKKYQ